jgi:glycerol-3-phosphate acyltransferase PlsY
VLGLLAAAVSGYLIGTVPCADTAARLATGGATDLRDHGTGNPGAVNAMGVLGKGWGWSILAADATKGALACGAGRRLGGAAGAHVAGTAAVIGHCFPVWNGFHGGKGVAVSVGQCATTFPAYLPIDLGVAWAVGKWKGRALPGTAAGCATWVTFGVLWWRKGWPNGWGPAPSVALPVSAAVSSAVILYRFATASPPVGGALVTGPVLGAQPVVET